MRLKARLLAPGEARVSIEEHSILSDVPGKRRRRGWHASVAYPLARST
jgi:hypothetical protein